MDYAGLIGKERKKIMQKERGINGKGVRLGNRKWKRRTGKEMGLR